MYLQKDLEENIYYSLVHNSQKTLNPCYTERAVCPPYLREVI